MAGNAPSRVSVPAKGAQMKLHTPGENAGQIVTTGRGQDVESIPSDTVYGCDLDSPDGLAIVGVGTDDDLAWISEGAEVLWDSAAPSTCDESRV